MTIRLSMSSLAGTARTLVAVGTSSDADMFLTTAAAAPRSTCSSSPSAVGTVAAAALAAGAAGGGGAAAGAAGAAGAPLPAGVELAALDGAAVGAGFASG